MEKKLKFLGLFFGIAGVYLFFQSASIFGGDAGDLVSAVCAGGIPHPQGYPLYTILGRIVNLFPFSTPAWRVSLLSSIPAAVTVVLVFYLIYVILTNKFQASSAKYQINSKHQVPSTKNLKFRIWDLEFSAFLAALIGSLTLAFSYFFWLYASVPELFSLNNLFLMVLLVLTISVIARSEATKQSERLLYLFSFVSGLAVFHHYYNLWYIVILGFFVFWRSRNLWQKKSLLLTAYCLLLFLLGVLPYLYVIFTALNYPLISWENVVGLESFLRLIARAHYGGFMTQAIALDSGLIQRLELLTGGFKLSLQYFGWPGMILAALGFIFLYQTNKKFFYLFLSLLLGSLLALFYTGFSLSRDDLFGLGMYARFALPTFVLDGILLGLGTFSLSQILGRFSRLKFFPILILLVLLLLPLSLFVKNYPKFLSLKFDQTAENFGRDILRSVPENGILFLEEDSPVFDTWYVRYCLNEGKKIKVMSSLPLNFENLQKNFPEIKVKKESGKSLFNQILENPDFKVFTNSIDLLANSSSVPRGLVWQYLPEGVTPPLPSQTLELNRQIWAGFYNPFGGILKWFRPVTLADVIRFYSDGAKKIGIYFLNNKEYGGAEEFFKKSLSYEEDNAESYLFLGQALSFQGKCIEAEEKMKRSLRKKPDFYLVYFSLSQNAKNCRKDQIWADRFMKLYEEKTAGQKTKLKDLGE